MAAACAQLWVTKWPAVGIEHMACAALRRCRPAQAQGCHRCLQVVNGLGYSLWVLMAPLWVTDAIMMPMQLGLILITVGGWGSGRAGQHGSHTQLGADGRCCCRLQRSERPTHSRRSLDLCLSSTQCPETQQLITGLGMGLQEKMVELQLGPPPLPDASLSIVLQYRTLFRWRTRYHLLEHASHLIDALAACIFKVTHSSAAQLPHASPVC
jgi:hypothetical protein